MFPIRKTKVIVPIILLTLSVLLIALDEKFSFFHLKKISSLQTFALIISVASFIFIILQSTSHEAENGYKEVFNKASFPMLITDKKTGKFCKVNKAALDCYEYTLDEFSKISMEDIRANNLNANDLEKQQYPKIQKHFKKSKEFIFCREGVQEILFNRAPALLFSTFDVTFLEKEKSELHEKESKLNLILKSITDGFFVMKYDLSIDRANDFLKKMVEVPVEEVNGKKLQELFPSLRDNFLHTEYPKALDNYSINHFDAFYKKTNSWFRVSAYPFDDGVSVFIRDITFEKENELQRYKSEQNLFALINNTDDLIWAIDTKHNFIVYNEPFKKAYKKIFKEDISIGQLALNINKSHETRRTQNWKNMYNRALSGEKFCVDMNFMVDGKHFTGCIHFNPIYNEHKKITGVGCFLQNKTINKSHEKKIRLQNEQLVKVAFITSHRVRAPLANILGLAEVLDVENPVSPLNKKIIEHLKTSAAQLDEMITNMVQKIVKKE